MENRAAQLREQQGHTWCASSPVGLFCLGSKPLRSKLLLREHTAAARVFGVLL